MTKKITIGKIVNAVGINGEVKVYNYSGFEDRYENLDRIITAAGEFIIENVRHQKGMIILKLSGLDDRNAAEALRGNMIYMTEDDLIELPEDEFYVRDMIGIEVYDYTSGEKLGELKDILTERPQDIYVVQLVNGGDVMIPAVDEFVKNINLKKRCMSVSLIEGMI